MTSSHSIPRAAFPITVIYEKGRQFLGWLAKRHFKHGVRVMQLRLLGVLTTVGLKTMLGRSALLPDVNLAISRQ